MTPNEGSAKEIGEKPLGFAIFPKPWYEMEAVKNTPLIYLGRIPVWQVFIIGGFLGLAPLVIMLKGNWDQSDTTIGAIVLTWGLTVISCQISRYIYWDDEAGRST